MNRTLLRYPNQQLMAQAIAARLVLTLNEIGNQPERERIDLAVTGGTDGTAILKAVASSDLLPIVDWSSVHIWFSDERFVTADSDERNDKAAMNACFTQLIDSYGMSASHIHAMPADTRDSHTIETSSDEDNARALEQAAQRYQMELIEELGDEAAMDIMLFGLGPDGHVASLFPDRQEVLLHDPQLLVAGIDHSPKAPPMRLTMSFPMINRASTIWVCGSRDAKAQAMAATFAAHDDPHWPASFLQATQSTYWIGDTASTAQFTK